MENFIFVGIFSKNLHIYNTCLMYKKRKAVYINKLAEILKKT